jgi:tryptophan 2,3-dioxygenase
MGVRGETEEPAGPPGGELSDPILPGDGASDYERYLHTDALLSLQTGPEDWVHRDELLFQVVHQSSELWLKLATTEVAQATASIESGDHPAAIRLMRRSILALRYVTEQLDMLEHMAPWEYHTVRKVLGHGSGFDSPGFRRVRDVTPRLGRAFHRALDAAGLDLVALHRGGREHEDLFTLEGLLIEWDERISVWRYRHYKVISRVIGANVVGTQGTPVEVLGRLIHQTWFPELWAVRTQLTELSNEEPAS